MSPAGAARLEDDEEIAKVASKTEELVGSFMIGIHRYKQRKTSLRDLSRYVEVRGRDG